MYYRSEHIVAMARMAEGFVEIPKGYWLAPIRTNLKDQKPNEFNDVVHLMHGEKKVMSTTCTTVPGLPALKGGYKKYNSKGAAVVCANVWMYDSFQYGLHRGRMKALRAVKAIFTTRDGNLNNKAEEYGNRQLGMWATNFHASTYKYLDKLVRKWIGHWSYGCIVCNNRQEYNKIIETVGKDPISMVIIPEFSV